jgi:hypothetical protein
MDEIVPLLDRMKELEQETYVYGPASEDSVRELEAVFGRAMPPTYRTFLKTFGAFSIIEGTYAGIMQGIVDGGRECAWTVTKLGREHCKLPDQYLVVEPDQDGYVCLDFSRTRPDGEHPVVYHMPFRETPFNELAGSYGEWLKETLKAYVDAWSNGVD